MQYTGETGRPLQSRITKHKCSTKMRKISKPKIAVHAKNTMGKSRNNPTITPLPPPQKRKIIRKMEYSSEQQSKSPVNQAPGISSI
jgi:hypothetical protein